jgi:hypothetical protein
MALTVAALLETCIGVPTSSHSSQRKSLGLQGSLVALADASTYKAAILPAWPWQTAAWKCDSCVTSGRKEPQEWPCSRSVWRRGMLLLVSELRFSLLLCNTNHFAEELDALTNTSVDIKSLGLHVKVQNKF